MTTLTNHGEKSHPLQWEFSPAKVFKVRTFTRQSENSHFWWKKCLSPRFYLRVSGSDLPSLSFAEYWVAELAGDTFSDWLRSRSKFFNPYPGLAILHPTAAQTLAIIVNPPEIYPCFHLRYDHTDSCYCRNGKVTPTTAPVFHSFLTPAPVPKEKRRILPDSTP